MDRHPLARGAERTSGGGRVRGEGVARRALRRERLHHAVGVEGGGGRPVREEAVHADLGGERVGQLKHVAVVHGVVVRRAVVPAAARREPADQSARGSST